MAGGFDAAVELWKLANIVTGFAVAQALAFSFALGKDLGRLQSASPRVKLVLVAISVLFAGFYSVAVHKCWDLAEPGSIGTAVWRETTYGRHAAIWLFTGLSVFGLYAPSFFGKIGSRPAKGAK